MIRSGHFSSWLFLFLVLAHLQTGGFIFFPFLRRWCCWEGNVLSRELLGCGKVCNHHQIQRQRGFPLLLCPCLLSRAHSPAQGCLSRASPRASAWDATALPAVITAALGLGEPYASPSAMALWRTTGAPTSPPQPKYRYCSSVSPGWAPAVLGPTGLAGWGVTQPCRHFLMGVCFFSAERGGTKARY